MRAKLTPPRSIAVLRGGALGDFVLTLPVIASLRASLPDAAVVLVAHPAYAALAAPAAILDVNGAALTSLHVPGGAAAGSAAATMARVSRTIAFTTDPDGVVAANLERWNAGPVAVS